MQFENLYAGNLQAMNHWQAKVYWVFCFQFLAGSLFGQAKEGCDKHYFKNHKISTTQCYQNSNFGKATAYSMDGKVIYEHEIRRVAGHSSVYFSYYENGAVSKAEWSSAPDGGIQWYRSVTTFGIDGSVTGFTESSYDDHPTLFAPHREPLLEQPVRQKKEVVECAVIYASEFWFINNTRQAIVVHADRMHGADDFHAVAIKPGDTAKAGVLILAQQFDEPEKYYRFSCNYRDKKKAKGLHVKLKATQQMNKEARRYYYSVR